MNNELLLEQQPNSDKMLIDIPSSPTNANPTVMGNTVKKESCPEFPYFGAKYPDATCIDGFLWDLDKCDDFDGETKLYGGGEEPCPFCNTAAFIEQHIDEDEELEENEKVTRQSLMNYVDNLRQKYGQ